MSPLRQRLLDRFDVKSLDALFYETPIALRFELGGDWEVEGRQVPRMLQAVDRARAITEAVFAGSTTVKAVIQTWGHRRPGPRNVVFRRLAAMGFTAAPHYEGRYRHPDEDAADPYDQFFLSEATDAEDRATLIWDACACEIGIGPSSPFISVGSFNQFRSLLVDFERGLLVNVYDDRGMDVLAIDREALRPIYARFNAWLLDYDRAAMDANFADDG